jgi:hypothetical protein
LNCTGTRRRSCRSALLLALAAALCGCMPGRSSYLRPSYPDPSSVLTRAACGGRTGPPADLSFSTPGQVGFVVSGRRAPADRRPAAWLVSIAITPPPDSGFRFISDALDVTSSDARVRPDALASTSQRLTATSWIEIPKLGPTPQDAAQRALDAQPEAFVSEALLEAEGIAGLPDRLRVALPAVQTASARLEAPPQELTADAAGSRAMQHESGPFNWSGRFLQPPGAASNQVRFELQISARTVEPWRIAAPVLRITDAATGETREHALAEMQASLRYPVTIDTKLRGSSARLLVVLPLLSSRPRYAVQLPAYEVHGQRYRLEAIELEVSQYDPGREPLDC